MAAVTVDGFTAHKEQQHRVSPPNSYIHQKNVKRGIERMDRHSASGSAINASPKKCGKGGRFTWEGPQADYGYADDQAAVDKNDPNYVDEDEEGGGEIQEQAPKIKEEPAVQDSEAKPQDQEAVA